MASLNRFGRESAGHRRPKSSVVNPKFIKEQPQILLLRWPRKSRQTPLRMTVHFQDDSPFLVRTSDSGHQLDCREFAIPPRRGGRRSVCWPSASTLETDAQIVLRNISLQLSIAGLTRPVRLCSEVSAVLIPQTTEKHAKVRKIKGGGIFSIRSLELETAEVLAGT